MSSTIVSIISAISLLVKIVGLADPADNFYIKKLLMGVRRRSVSVDSRRPNDISSYSTFVCYQVYDIKCLYATYSTFVCYQVYDIKCLHATYSTFVCYQVYDIKCLYKTYSTFVCYQVYDIKCNIRYDVCIGVWWHLADR